MAGGDIGGGPKRKKSAEGEEFIRHQKSRVGIHIDMTPMVDVAMLLLIFFMVTTVFRNPQAMELSLPPNQESVSVPESNVMTLYVNEDGSMQYDVGRQGLNPVSWDELREVLVLEADYNPELIVLAKVDRKARYEYMVDLLDTFDDAQMDRISVNPMTEEDKALMEGM